MRTLDFLVVGTARAGTTALHSYLSQHGELFLPRLKEPCFFAFEKDKGKYVNGKFAFAIRCYSDYERLFLNVDKRVKIGEMSTPYLYLYDKTISSIKKHFSDYRKIRIVIFLRNPVDRAFSQYKWRVRDGREDLSFAEAINAEKERMNQNYSFDYFYVDRSFYFRQVEAYIENFDHVHVVLFDDFQNDPNSVLKKLCRFLEVSENFSFAREKRQNESLESKSKFLSRLVTSESWIKFKLLYLLPDWLRKKMRLLFFRFNVSKNRRIELNKGMREKLMEIYREDILSLQKLLNLDLSDWLK